jgi:alpha-L-rhamnosidase
MNSFNHYSLGSCGEWMFDAVAGIGLDPDQPGFKHIIIKPVMGGDLTWVKAHYDTVHGRIVSEWERKEKQLTLHVVIPANTTATIYVPAGDLASVLEGGKPAAKSEGVRFLRKKNAAAVFEAGSGTYDFTTLP